MYFEIDLESGHHHLISINCLVLVSFSFIICFKRYYWSLGLSFSCQILKITSILYFDDTTSDFIPLYFLYLAINFWKINFLNHHLLLLKLLVEVKIFDFVNFIAIIYRTLLVKSMSVLRENYYFVILKSPHYLILF